MKIKILNEAQQDLIDGFHFYESQAPGLGDYFLDSLFADIDSLQIYASIHAQYFGFYRLLAKRFPFAIYYRIETQIVQIRAVLDCRKSPAWLRERLT